MKTYIMPVVQVEEAEVVNMMAISLQGGSADPDSEVLSKEDKDWGLWNDEE